MFVIENTLNPVVLCRLYVGVFSDKYDQIENELIEEFRIAHREGDRRKMKRCASVLSNFKVYPLS